MPACTRLPSKISVCRQRPPAPGCHLRAWGWFDSPSHIRHESPPSSLLKSEAGSTPAHRSFFPSPGASDQMLASARPSSLGKAGADFVSLKVFPRSVERSTFIPKKGLHEEAYTTGLPRVSKRAE